MSTEYFTPQSTEYFTPKSTEYYTPSSAERFTSVPEQSEMSATNTKTGNILDSSKSENVLNNRSENVSEKINSTGSSNVSELLPMNPPKMIPSRSPYQQSLKSAHSTQSDGLANVSINDSAHSIQLNELTNVSPAQMFENSKNSLSMSDKKVQFSDSARIPVVNSPAISASSINGDSLPRTTSKEFKSILKSPSPRAKSVNIGTNSDNGRSRQVFESMQRQLNQPIADLSPPKLYQPAQNVAEELRNVIEAEQLEKSQRHNSLASIEKKLRPTPKTSPL